MRNNDKLSSIISDNISAVGQNVRKYYQRRLPSNPNLDYYYILRDTPNNESIIVEYGFADNVDDANFLKSNWQDLAEAVVKSIANYIGVNYIPITSSNTYIVKSGDTLWSIARNIGLTVDELKRLNNLTSNTLSVGQVLKLSENSNNDNNTYVVKSGDTLYGIAKKFNMSVDDLKKLNNLSSNVLTIGQVLKITKKEDNNLDDKNIYIVKSGDSLYKIANLYGITVNDLKAANNLNSNLLTIGQKLIIPKNIEKSYTVQKGDTLYSIARANNTTVSDIVNLNNLQNNSLSIGQKLLLP